MKIRWMNLTRWAVLAAALPTLTGCAAFRARTAEVDVNETRHMGANYDYSDMRKITESLAGEIAASPFLNEKPAPPVMMIAGVENRTTRHVDTKNLTDRMRTLLIQSNRIRFVNETRREDLLREQGFQAANVTPGQQVAIGQQLGAQYMMTGSLTEMKQESPRQVRVSKTKLNYYKLTFEITDLQSSEIVWISEREFAREERLPLIGW